MTQTTDGMSFIKAKVFVSPDNSTWTDVSGHGAGISVSGGSRGAGEQNTFDGDTPIVVAGKRASIDVTVRYVYTQESDQPFEIIRGQYETEGGPLYVQYSPEDPSGYWFKTGASVITEFGYPVGDADSADVVLSEFTVKCAALEKAAASTGS